MNKRNCLKYWLGRQSFDKCSQNADTHDYPGRIKKLLGYKVTKLTTSYGEYTPETQINHHNFQIPDNFRTHVKQRNSSPFGMKLDASIAKSGIGGSRKRRRSRKYTLRR